MDLERAVTNQVFPEETRITECAEVRAGAQTARPLQPLRQSALRPGLPDPGHLQARQTAS